MTLKIMDGYAYMRLEIKDVLMDIYMSKEQAENSYSIQGIDSNVAMIEWEE